MNPQDDPQGQAAAPEERVVEGQPAAGQQGNAEDSGKPEANSPTEFVEVKGVKIPAGEFEQLAKEKFKDRFEAFENREKWQKENTRKAMELAEERKLAEQFRRLSADPRFREFMSQGERNPQNQFEAQQQAYVQRKVKEFPDVDPRFFASQFNDIWEMSGNRAQSSIIPLIQQQAEVWEKEFLSSHPLIEKGSDKYYEVAEIIGKGYDPEHAYNLVFREELTNQTVEERIKKRDDEAKKKLQQKPVSSASGGQKRGSSDDSFERAWAKHGDA